MKFVVFGTLVCICVSASTANGQILGGKPATLETTYKTEYAWANGEAVADIAEVAEALRRAKPAFEVPANLKPWNPQMLVPLAQDLVGPPSPKAPAEPALADQYPLLANLTAPVVARASDTVSGALQQNLRSVRAHESAALVLGAFGLREAADDLTDVRWTLNRMTAHLAIADALRPPDRTPGRDGQLARVVFLALANRTTSALQSLDAIADQPGDAPLAAWKRALRLRLTHDWRTTAAPAKGHRIEKLEYFRARRKTLRYRRAGQELSELLEPPAIDFSRIVQNFDYGVEDGNDIVETAIGGELLELSEVHKIVMGRDLPSSLPAELMNIRAGRLMSPSGPRVIPWGAWAEFSQRHIGMYIGEIDQFYRQRLAIQNRADTIKARMDLFFGHLTLFPVASARRTKGEGTEADLTYINRAIDVAVRTPELVNYDYWMFLQFGAHYEVVKRGMPTATPWFAPPSAEVAFDAGRRSRELMGQLSTPDVEALVAEASADVSLAAYALRPRPESQKLVARIVAWLKSRAAFDLYAVDAAVNWARTLEDQIAWRRQGCALAVTQCLDLAWLLAYAGDEAGAVAEYERAFRDPSLDAVTLANNSAWLVAFYERTAQMPRAYDLAQRSADTGSARGLETLARLYERRARISEAAVLFERMSQRYKTAAPALAGFLYRQAIVAKRSEYLERWRQVERQLFPGGLQPVPAEQTEQPIKGVFVDDDGSAARRVRVQIGDIIVGVDGWKVENEDQLNAVLAFGHVEVRHKFTAWRGILFTVELPRNHGLKLEDYPLRGWIR